MADIVGFRVTIATPDGSESEDDFDWTIFSGGGESIHPCSPSIFQCLPQTPTLDSFTLRGPVTSSRKALCDWINATVDSAGFRGGAPRDVRITELLQEGGAVQEGRSLTYYDCHLVECQIPRLDAASSCSNLIEEVSIKPSRIEMK